MQKNCIEDVKLKKPDLILLDIMMPDLDGYEACKLLKSSAETSDIPIIFLSGLDTPQDRIEGYVCGAEDYITKPFDSDEMVLKINIALENAKEQRLLKEQFQAKQRSDVMAKNAIEQSFEYGILMDFHRRCSASPDYESLGEEVLRCCKQLGLAVSLEVVSATGNHYFGCQSNSLEGQLLARCIDDQSHIHVKSRSIFKRKNAALLIKNMPFEDMDRYGRFKDHLQVLINSTSDHISLIDLQNQTSDDLVTKGKVTEWSARVKQATADQNKEAISKVSKLFWSIEEKVLGLGLEDDQEKRIFDMLREGEKSIGALFEHSGTLNDLMDEFTKL